MSTDLLRDIHLPEPIGWEWSTHWVLTIAGVFFLILALALMGLKFFQKHQQTELWQKELNAFLKRECHPMEVAKLLKRYALTRFPNKGIASLTDAKWCAFLDLHYPLSQDLEWLFKTGIYQKDPHFDKERLKIYCRNWMKNV